MSLALAEQPSLFDERERTIQERFERFHADHPEVYEKLREYAFAVKGRGCARLGIRLLWERVRWFFWFERESGEPYRCNDHYHSRYARLLMENEPDLRGFFELRGLRAE